MEDNPFRMIKAGFGNLRLGDKNGNATISVLETRRSVRE